jgi:hypothetical protein
MGVERGHRRKGSIDLEESGIWPNAKTTRVIYPDATAVTNPVRERDSAVNACGTIEKLENFQPVISRIRSRKRTTVQSIDLLHCIKNKTG